MSTGRTVRAPFVLAVILLMGNSAYSGIAIKTGIFDYGPNPGPGAFLNRELIDFVWSPGTFAVPPGSKNQVLSGAANPRTDYIYGVEVLNNRRGTDPVPSFIAGNCFKGPITSIGAAANSIPLVCPTRLRSLLIVLDPLGLVGYARGRGQPICNAWHSVPCLTLGPLNGVSKRR
jgi:hypothetical protein